MKQNNLKKTGSFLFLAAAALSVAGCSTKESAAESITYTETEESQLSEPMENQPESSYWFPEDLLKWNFNKDPDAKYNVSMEPLAKRVDKKTLPKSNETQNEDMKVVALSIMNSSTSGNAPRGINTFDANVFSYWQYIDQLVYWGGSSGEGIIVPPSADVIDAAHKNGVPVLGTIFFPQTAHSGKIEWLNTFLEKDAKGEFPIVDKLIEVADKYGFDGWFINQETDTKVTSFDDAAEGKQTDEEAAGGLTKKHADLMQELIAEMQQKTDENFDVMWYDSMTDDGEMDWQNALTDKNKSYLVDAEMKPLSDSMFLNFWWNTEKLAKEELLKSSKEKAEELNIDPYDLYAGIDLQENGYMTPVQWDLFTDDKGNPYTSLGLYVPSWTYDSASDPDDFQDRENTFWVNAKGDPTQGTPAEGTDWPGISTYAIEQTAITSLPFVTNFNLGNGYNYFIEGEKVSSMDWNNRSMQDILPTYRWIFDHAEGNTLAASIDYADAFNGGNSLKLRGNMQADQTSLMKMYETRVKIDKDTNFTTTAKATAETELDLVLGYEDGETEVIKADKPISSDWTTVTYNVEKAAGKVITSISYNITATKNSDSYELLFGQLAVTPKAEKTKLAVSGVEIEDALFDEEESNYAGIRLAWDEDKTNNVDYYEIYRVNKDKSRSFLGATPAANHYINALERNDDTNKTDFEIVPVDYFGARGKASKIVTLEWPDNRIPKAAFTASQTLAAPGESITFTNTSSSNTESLKWEFEGADMETSTDEAPVVTYAKEGTYNVKLTAENKAGETPLEVEGLITISKKAEGGLEMMSQGKSVEASSFVNDAEGPEFIVDGKMDTKWAAIGNPPHEITIDLGEIKTVSEVHIAHAEAGGEGPDMNTKVYSIEVSEDGKEFTQVSKTINNTEADSVNTFTAVPARYIKLIIDKPTQGSDSAARIYEVEVYGLTEVLK